MRYNIGDSVKVLFARDNELCQIVELKNGYIVTKNIVTSAIYVVTPEMIIKNITEEIEKENNKTPLEELYRTSLNETYEEIGQLKEENEKLKKDLEEKQEANEILYLEIKKLSTELALAKKSEKHLEICEKALLEKDAEIERLREENEEVIKNEKRLYLKLWKRQHALNQITKLEKTNADYADRMGNVYKYLNDKFAKHHDEIKVLKEIIVLDKEDLEHIHNMFLGSEQYDSNKHNK